MKKNLIILTCVLIGTALLSFSCGGTNKHFLKNKKSATENNLPKIKEVEEKLVPINKKLPDPHRYFVIIGSFRNPDNAKKYQGEILKDGFNSMILKNEAGLYRVSVKSTDDIELAREDIKRIKRLFLEYYDTWLLIQKK